MAKRKVLHSRFLAAGFLLLAAAVYLFLLYFRCAAYWGAGSYSLPIGITLAILSVCSILLRPIPVKLSTIFLLYLILFGVFADFLSLFLSGHFWDLLHPGGLFPLMCSIFLLLYGYFHGKRIRETHYVLPLGKQLRIAMISDVHMGKSIHAAGLEKLAGRIAEAKPDLFVICGDLCDDQTTAADMKTACEILGSVSSTFGTYMVFGNHDLGNHGPPLQYSTADYRECLADNGISVLADDRIALTEDITLVGRKDVWLAKQAARASIPELLQSEDTGKLKIILDHQPSGWKEAVDTGVALQLSGHTHAGQVWPLGLLWRLMPSYGTHYGHKERDGCHLVVSSGVGCRGATLRSGCTAEYGIIDLKKV